MRSAVWSASASLCTRRCTDQAGDTYLTARGSWKSTLSMVEERISVRSGSSSPWSMVAREGLAARCQSLKEDPRAGWVLSANPISLRTSAATDASRPEAPRSAALSKSSNRNIFCPCHNRLCICLASLKSIALCDANIYNSPRRCGIRRRYHMHA